MNAALVARVAGILSPYVGSVAALEGAANAVQAAAPGCGVTLPQAVQACIARRRTHSTLYLGWSQVTAEQAGMMVAAVSRMATQEEA